MSPYMISRHPSQLICFLRHPWDSTGGTTWSSGLWWSSLLWPGTLEPEPWWWGSVLPCFPGSVADNLGVDGAAHTVAKLGIQLGKLVAGVNAGLRDIPHRSSLHNVPDHELLDGLILGNAFCTVSTTHGLHVAPPVLVTPIVTALGCHSFVEVNQATVSLVVET